ncbi:LOW QUALITY PROTEIN: uncharacterized protein LOC115684711 [Syzygium oleosum]|uniref:LOW QUALITY PROTEIN: uncharacterized protein LOC115684711 n=1 Tax=Syzygium oleosum TaxID=219896 RepID=UPI0024BAED19|nr:LOW QUALITY PROTEIN: uncharacterized protein LOC115684711 [Syzygium oleosum]
MLVYKEMECECHKKSNQRFFAWIPESLIKKQRIGPVLATTMLVMLPSSRCPWPCCLFFETDLSILRNKLMELELGLKITQTQDDISSTADLRIAKDGGGIVFLSRETENMFILTAHLRGYRREHIDININEDGTRITIIGNKAVQEKVMLGWILYKKEVELRGFKKAFKIPGGVVLDKIKAKFDEDGAILTVFMPKMVQGVSGHAIEEVEEPEDDRGHMTKTDCKEVPGVIEEPQIEYPRDEVEQQTKEEAEGAARESELPHTSSASQRLPAEGPVPRPLQKEETEMGAQLTKSEDNQQPGKVIASLDAELKEGDSLRQEETSDIGNEVQSESPKDDKHRDVSENTASVKSKPKKSKKICAPVVAGSALLVSLIVLAIHLIRSKR